MEKIDKRDNGDHDVMASLEAIQRSPGFAASAQMYSFLKYVVLQKLEGKEDRIKAYSIALDALGRSKSFDPQADPIVRVIAGRLRAALSMYYAADGSNDPIRIEIPKGSYRPVFINQPNSPTKNGLGVMNLKFFNQLGQMRSSIIAVLITSLVFLTAFQFDRASSTAESATAANEYTPATLPSSSCSNMSDALDKLALHLDE